MRIMILIMIVALGLAACGSARDQSSEIAKTFGPGCYDAFGRPQPQKECDDD